MQIHHHFCSVCHSFDSDAEESLSKRETKYQGFHVQKLWCHVAAHKDTPDVTATKKRSFNWVISNCRPWNRSQEGEHKYNFFSIECSKTDYLRPVIMRVHTRGIPFANVTVDQMYIPSRNALMIRRSGNFDAAWATVFLHSAANCSNTFPKPKLFLTWVWMHV